MTGPKGNSAFCFPETSPRGTSDCRRETKLTVSRGASHFSKSNVVSCGLYSYRQQYAHHSGQNVENSRGAAERGRPIFGAKLKAWRHKTFRFPLLLRRLERVFRCYIACETMEDYKEGCQEPITRSQQLPHIPVTAFSQTCLFLA